MVTVLGIEARPVNKVKTAANDVTGCKCRAVCLACARTAKAVTVVAVISVRMFVPTRQPIHVHTLSAKSYSHVPVTAFGNDFDLKVINSTRSRYGMSCPD